MSEQILPLHPDDVASTGGGAQNLASLINAFSVSAQSTNGGITAQGLIRLQTYLADTPLRYFVYRSSGFGNQANTVNLLKRMIVLGFTNPVELIYDVTNGSEVIDKLAVLLPGLDPKNPQPYLLNGVTITFFPYKEKPSGGGMNRSVSGLSGQVPLCINGGAEITSITKQNLASALQVDFYLQLQPYMWEIVNSTDNPISLILPKGADNYIDLAKQPSLQERAFSYRAFAMQTPLEPDWAQLLQIPNINKEVIGRAKAVVDLVMAQKIQTLPVYGLYDSAWGRKPVIGGASEMPFELATACALAQKTGNPFTQPIVIILLNQLQPTTFQALKNFIPVNAVAPIAGNPAELDQDDRIVYYTQRWCISKGLYQPNNQSQPAKPGNIYIEPDISKDDLNALVGQLANHGVIVINLPGLPQDLFNYFYEIAALPSVFEGQGTANLALNLGKPFFKLTKAGINPYPSSFGSPLFDTTYSAKAMQQPSTPDVLSNTLYRATYDLIQIGIYQFKNGYSAETRMPPEMLADLLVEQAKDYAKKNGNWKLYFEGLKRWFSDSANDKLLQALVFLVMRVNPNKVPSSTTRCLQAFVAEGDAQTPLEQLDQQLQDATSKGVLNLFPRVFSSGSFNQFITAIIGGNSFTIGSAQQSVVIDYPEGGDKITVTGSTLNFLGLSLKTVIEFTMNADGESIDTTFNLELGEVSLNAVAWFTLHSAKVNATIPGNDERITGAVVCDINVGDNPINFTMDFPSSAEGKIVIDGDLSVNPPSLNDLFALLGGINFMRTLPSAINGAGNIALHQLKFGYDYATSAIDVFELLLVNSQPWELFPKLTLNNLQFTMDIAEPTGSRRCSWQASSQVVIGPGSIDVAVSYPNLTASASLTEGSDPIPLGDLIFFFLPPEYSINLNADLGNFSMTVVPSEKGAESVYNISAGIQLNSWDLSLGVATFSLTNLFINIEGTGAEVTGTLSADTVLFSEQPEIAVQMNATATYAGDGAWSFVGQQGDSAIKVKQIIQTYLGSGWWVDGMPNLDIAELVVKVESAKTSDSEGDENSATSYMVGGTVTVWNTPLGDDFKSIIMGQFGSGSAQENVQVRAALVGKALVPVLSRSGGVVPMQPKTLLLTEAENANSSYGHVSAQILWNNIDLTVFYDYEQGYNAYGFFWGPLSARIDSKTNTATLKFTDSTSLGAMVETFISWMTGSTFGLAAPWNVMNNITLANFSLIWNFSDNSVKFRVDIGPLDLIFAKITGFSLEYQPKGENKGVHVTLEGDFLWEISSDNRALTDDGGLTWNAADPSSTPSPPGSGNKYLDLRLLAAGQHVQVAGLQRISSVQEAIDLLAALPVPDGKSVPQIGFDAANNWLFATDFGVLKIEDKKGEGSEKDDAENSYVFTLQVVFTDPTLYALRIALEGEAAKVFAGLDFQIIYRKISDGLGVFQAEITLPTLMRRIDVGAVTITLPTFGVEVYTNGDFKFDVGFPWNQNFARSFSVEAIIPPGIPALGSGGFYFGKLPAVVISQLPLATNGFFNPNLVFGFGAQLGLGKSLDVGILKAGFSLTVFGILEGILAKWNPYDVSNTGSSNAMTLQGQYYFQLQGTFGIIGHLYGSVDFVIIKASVDINLKLYAQITLASYSPIPISVSVEVSVSAKAEINLGLFKISISFSFSTHIQESFTLGYLQRPEDAPWRVTMKSDGGRLLSQHSQRRYLRVLNETAQSITPQWNHLLARTSGDNALVGYLGFALSIAGDNAFNSVPADISKQFPCYVASLFIDAPGAATGDSSDNLLRAAGNAQDTSFEKIAKMVARWAVAAIQPAALTPEQVDAAIVTDEALEALINYLSDAENVPMPLSVADIEQFMDNQFRLTVSLPPDVAGNVDAAYFPMAVNLNIAMPGWGGQPDIDYTFAGYNSVSDDFVTFLREYFDQLAVQVEQESGKAGLKTFTAYRNNALSVASFIFSDYFVLIMRQMLQAMRDGLRDFTYPLAVGECGNGIVNWVNTTGQLVAAGTPFSLYDLFKGNESHPLSVGKTLQLPLVSYVLSATDSFTSVAAQHQYGGAFDAAALATNNADVAGILLSGATVTYSGTPYVISGSETLTSLAARIGTGVSLAQLFANSDVLTLTHLFQDSATLTVPPFGYTIKSDDTLLNVATAYGITVGDLAGVDRETVNSPIATRNGDITDLFVAQDENQQPLMLNVVALPQFQVAALLAEAQRVNAINHLSGMASRYYFHGLRLPTDKITPNKPGMWVTKNAQTGALSLPDYAGLFALTGQQLPLSTLPDTPLTITLSKGGAIDWLAFANDVSALTFTVTPPDKQQTQGDSNYQRIVALNTYATTTILPAGPEAIDAWVTVEDEPARYPLSNGIGWQSRHPIIFPSGAVGTQTRIWPLPDAMLALTSLGDPDTEDLQTGNSPNFDLEAVRMNVATGKAEDTPVERVAWASSVEFTVKKLSAGSTTTSSASDCTYEVMGASASDALILERMVQYVHDDSEYASMVVGYQSASSSSGVTFSADTGAGVVFGISQTNLSTVTRPPAGFLLAARLSAEDDTNSNLLNKPTELVRLLWEASITRAGGFFLYYFDADSGAGLPDAAFNDKGEATINLIAMYAPQPRLQSYMNAVVTGDAMDISSSTLVAKARSQSVSHVVTAGDSLAAVVSRYFSNLVSLVDNTLAAGGTFALTTGGQLAVNNGLYRVPVDGSAPGGQLSAIANWFNMDTAAIKSANPRITDTQWKNGLARGVAIRLPAVRITVGSAPGGTTLVSIAAWYGTSVMVLAGQNATTVSLLSTGQTLTLMSGPLSQSATEIPGVQPILATRTGLPDIPAKPTDPQFAADFLLNNFTLLAYQVEANADFNASNVGLPLGPQSDDAASGDGKVRVVRTLTREDALTYSTSVPYTQFVQGSLNPGNPYSANGRIIQISYEWNDLYGNRMVSTLDDNDSAVGANNNTPALTGYTDNLMTIAQWPSISTSWSVANTVPAGERFLIQLTSAFDPSAFNPSQDDVANAWQSRAYSSLQTLNAILYQLDDPNGIALFIDSTLVAQSMQIDSKQIGVGDQYGATDTLTGWLVTIQTFLAARAQGDTHLPDPTPLSFMLSVSAAKVTLNPASVFPLTLSVTLKRTGGIAEGDFAAVNETLAVTSAISAKTDAGTQDLSAGSHQNILQSFARDIDETLSENGKFALVIAQGTDRYLPTAGIDPSAVWGMRIAVNHSGNGIAWQTNDVGQPELFAPEPVSNTLVTRDAQVWPYSKLTDFDPKTNRFTTTAVNQTWSGTDVDSWLSSFFSFFDTLFSPEFTSSILVIDAKATNKPIGVESFMTELAKQKEILAQAASELMGPIYAGQSSTRLASARQELLQSLLVKLSNLYTVRAAVSFGATVSADIPQRVGEQSPQLFGNLTWNTDSEALQSLVTLTSPKMPLVTGDNQPITFLLSSAGNIKVNGEVVQSVTLDLAWAGAAIEHQVSAIPGIEGYLASSWLSPIWTDNNSMLSGNLGRFTVPLLLRDFPATPRMMTQNGMATNTQASELNQLTQWNYSYTYSTDFHFEQDRIYNEVSYNLRDNDALRLASYMDAFQGLAQFISSQKTLTQLLGQTVPLIDARTTDQQKINDASLALGAYLKIVTDIAAQASAGGMRIAPAAAPQLTGATWHFWIAEETHIVTIDKVEQAVWVVTLNSTDGAPTGMETEPVVQIEGYTAVPIDAMSHPDRGLYAWYYLDSNQQPLTAEVAQGIAARTVLSPGMQILERQDAISTVYLTRNEDIDGVISQPFVFTTPTVSFGNPLHPTLRADRPVNIATLDSPDGSPITRTLEQHLSALFNALFDSNVSGDSTIQINSTWIYRLTTELSGMSVPLPVAIMPPLPVNIDGKGVSPLPLNEMVSTLSTTITDWQQTYKPSTLQATLTFDITIMSDLTVNPMPLLNLSALYLPVQYITPA
ncbi:hypothetical protein LHK94_02535 [Dickeya zeae]|uniref:LysM peptidoglycan-binding domain-containing protein n=1 Tax=Dickeya zeae TaxID=204042 RepID=UPI001CFA9D6D|nr:LysM peptidoglycan-binding domain-containing protein [Dickeya zeae]UCZ75913.1 hypothetical protein LHK94_02535 [Dickeya zeae]